MGRASHPTPTAASEASRETLKLGRTFLCVQPRPEAVEVVPSQSRRFGELVAESLAMREVFAVLELAAQAEITALLEGETGTGKELHEAEAPRTTLW